MANWDLGPFQRYRKDEVLLWLRQGHTVITTTKKPASERTWLPGARVIPTKDYKFITTEPNPHLNDNLGNLPSCSC